METQKVRKIRTLHFGELTIEDYHVFLFPNGILGFENLREFVLISDESTLPFKWLINLEEPNIGFPLISPWFLDLDYRPGKQFEGERKVLFAVVTLEDDDGNMTANLKAPIILDVDNQSGEQVILPADKYSPVFIIPKG